MIVQLLHYYKGLLTFAQAGKSQMPAAAGALAQAPGLDYSLRTNISHCAYVTRQHKLRHMGRSLFSAVFLGWFALWFVASRYVGFSFYRLLLGEAVEFSLGTAALLVVLALVIQPIFQKSTEMPSRWRYVLLCGAALAMAELGWRLGIGQLHWEVGKILGVVLDLSTPALVAVGLAVVLSEWRASGARSRLGAKL